MSSSHFSTIPAWLSKPSQFQNVISNPFSSLQDVSSFINISDSSHFSVGLKQALFWRKRLSPSVSPSTVIFSFLSTQGLVLPNVLEVCQALKHVCNTLLITEIYRASNSNFIGISFSNPLEASKIRQHFSYFKDSIVIHVPLSSSLIHNFKLLWLPPLFPDARIHHFLNKHSEFHQFSRETTPIDSNHFSPTNSVTGTLRLHPRADITLLPHLVPLPAPHLGHALFIVSGRPPYCLRCGLTGHVRRVCPTPRCTSCRQYHLPSTSCSTHSSSIHPALADFWIPDSADTTSTSAPPKELYMSPLITATDAPNHSSQSSTLYLDSSSTAHLTITSPSQSTPVINTDSSPSSPKSDCTFPMNLAVSSPMPTLSPQHFSVTTPAHTSTALDESLTFSIHSSGSTTSTRQSAPTLSCTIPSITAQSPALHNLFLTLPDETDMLVDPSSEEDPSFASITKNSTSSPQELPINKLTFSGSTGAAVSSDVTLLVSSTPKNSSFSTTIVTPLSDSPKEKPSRKRAKHSAPELSVISSCALKSISQAHISSWADQVEEALTTTSVTSSILTNMSSSPLSSTTAPIETSKSTSLNITSATTSSSLDSSPDSNFSATRVTGSPLPLVYTAAIKHTSYGLQVPPSHFVASPTVTSSWCTIACPRCFLHNDCSWPPVETSSCYNCNHPIIVLHHLKFIPTPSARYVFLILSPEDFTDPILLDFLLFCLRFKVPLLPYLFTSPD